MNRKMNQAICMLYSGYFGRVKNKPKLRNNIKNNLEHINYMFTYDLAPRVWSWEQIKAALDLNKLLKTYQTTPMQRFKLKVKSLLQ